MLGRLTMCDEAAEVATNYAVPGRALPLIELNHKSACPWECVKILLTSRLICCAMSLCRQSCPNCLQQSAHLLNGVLLHSLLRCNLSDPSFELSG
jgi:hypothetical protein